MFINKYTKILIHEVLSTDLIKKYFRNRTNQIVNSILYHDVGTNINNLFDGKHKLSIDLKDFEKQIKWLNECFNIILPEDIFSETNNNKPKLIITFDDGYYGVLKNALHILKKYSIPAVIFLNKKYINNKCYPEFIIDKAKKHYNKSDNDILHNEEIYKYFKEKNIQEKIFLDENDCKTIENDYDNLIKFGCHSFSHHNLMYLNYENLVLELEKNSLKNYSNYSNSFSIPFGVYKEHYNKKTLKVLSEYGFNYIFLNNGCLNTKYNMNFKSSILVDRIIAPNSYSKHLFINLVENISLKNIYYLYQSKFDKIKRVC